MQLASRFKEFLLVLHAGVGAPARKRRSGPRSIPYGATCPKHRLWDVNSVSTWPGRQPFDPRNVFAGAGFASAPQANVTPRNPHRLLPFGPAWSPETPFENCAPRERSGPRPKSVPGCMGWQNQVALTTAARFPTAKNRVPRGMSMGRRTSSVVQPLRSGNRKKL